MSMRVLKTTDHKYEGLIIDINPRNPPLVISGINNDKFDPTHWLNIRDNIWKIYNYNYIVIAEEI